VHVKKKMSRKMNGNNIVISNNSNNKSNISNKKNSNNSNNNSNNNKMNKNNNINNDNDIVTYIFSWQLDVFRLYFMLFAMKND